MFGWLKSKTMVNQNAIYKECLTKGVSAISFKGKSGRVRKYMNARRLFNLLIEEEEREEAAISIALFEAADWDWDEYIKAIKAVNKTLKKYKKLAIKAQ